ncbi:hypothetical protein [Actinoallomurus sp. NPDC050550]|uniref:hypothetical protein n=1 Tax=Actinoallomurus sp. NPDC050550 TaxID=3154937 RepID=UPI0033FD1147
MTSAVPDPDHPAPLLRLTPQGAANPTTTASAADPTSGGGVATGLAIAALVVVSATFAVQVRSIAAGRCSG